MTEKLVVNRWLRPALTAVNLIDQFAFKQTGSTECALIKLFDTVTSAFERGNKYVKAFLVDFSKAFDTVDHAIIIRKLNHLDMPPSIKQWIFSFLYNRAQIVKVNGHLSSAVPINRGIVQGSALGPYLFLLMIADLVPQANCNTYIKYADDLTVLVPEDSDTQIEAEFQHIRSYADINNLYINEIKTKETIFYNNRIMNCFSPSVPGIEIIDCGKLLGVFIDHRMTFQEHVKNLLTICSQRLYLLKLLKTQGLSLSALHIVYNSLIIGRIIYCLSAWGGFVKVCDIERFNSLFRRAKRYGYTDVLYDFKGLLYTSDSKLFSKIQHSQHCLNHILPPDKIPASMDLRKRGHTFTLPGAHTPIYKNSFLIRCLYSFY